MVSPNPDLYPDLNHNPNPIPNPNPDPNPNPTRTPYPHPHPTPKVAELDFAFELGEEMREQEEVTHTYP